MRMSLEKNAKLPLVVTWLFLFDETCNLAILWMALANILYFWAVKSVGAGTKP
jgi:hypothetical protein